MATINQVGYGEFTWRERVDKFAMDRGLNTATCTEAELNEFAEEHVAFRKMSVYADREDAGEEVKLEDREWRRLL